KQKHADDQQLIWHHFYRTMVFNWGFPTYRPKQRSLMDVIQRYNPIIATLPKEKLILAKKDRLIVKKGKYFLSYPMWLAMHRTANFLSKRKIPNKAKSRLYKWSIADFKKTPKNTSEFYRYLLDTVIPVFYSPQKGVDRKQFRLNVYAKFYFLLQKDSLAKRSNDDLMDIVTRYQPLLSANEKKKIIVTKEGSGAAIEQLTPQALLLRQQMSAQILQIHGNIIRQNQKTMSSFYESMNDARTKTIIGLSNDEIIDTYDDSFLVETPNGETYHISR
ncbi:MAG: hypothetical protein KAG20_06655, partial [Cocleimonas sp.]|nr:hypothetical protein [Cocleimonas sp.]